MRALGCLALASLLLLALPAGAEPGAGPIAPGDEANIARDLAGSSGSGSKLPETAYRPRGNDGDLHGHGLRYPEARRIDLVEDHFGVKVRDPYRWLEKEPRDDPAVRDWVGQENRLTRRYIDGLPGRETLKKRMQALFAHGRYMIPRKAGGRYFYGYNKGLQNQTPLYVRDGLNGAQRLLIDPNAWAEDGSDALAEWAPSPDGRFLLYAVQEAGSDWRTLKVLDVASARPLDDVVQWVKFSQLAWDGQGQGFFYSRFDAPRDGAGSQSATVGQQLYYHRLGTAQAQDQLIYATPDQPRLSHTAQVTQDGRWLVISSFQGTDPRRELHLAELTGGKVKIRPLVKGITNDWRLIGSRGSTLYFVTDQYAPHLRVVSIDARFPGAAAHRWWPNAWIRWRAGRWWGTG